jgi:hypothetical protein
MTNSPSGITSPSRAALYRTAETIDARPAFLSITKYLLQSESSIKKRRFQTQQYFVAFFLTWSLCSFQPTCASKPTAVMAANFVTYATDCIIDKLPMATTATLSPIKTFPSGGKTTLLSPADCFTSLLTPTTPVVANRGVHLLLTCAARTIASVVMTTSYPAISASLITSISAAAATDVLIVERGFLFYANMAFSEMRGNVVNGCSWFQISHGFGRNIHIYIGAASSSLFALTFEKPTSDIPSTILKFFDAPDTCSIMTSTLANTARAKVFASYGSFRRNFGLNPLSSLLFDVVFQHLVPQHAASPCGADTLTNVISVVSSDASKISIHCYNYACGDSCSTHATSRAVEKSIASMIPEAQIYFVPRQSLKACISLFSVIFFFLSCFGHFQTRTNRFLSPRRTFLSEHSLSRKPCQMFNSKNRRHNILPAFSSLLFLFVTLLPSAVMSQSPPITAGLIAHYNADSWTGSRWTDLSGAGNHVTEVGGTSISVARPVGAPAYVYGARTAWMTFPAGILPSAQYTLFFVARYNGAARDRIFQGVNSNWLSGFWRNRAGGACHGPCEWITAWQGGDIHGSDWVLGSDRSNSFRSNGVDRTTNAANGCQAVDRLAINYGNHGQDSSDFAIQSILVYNVKLSDADVQRVEAWLNIFQPAFTPANLQASVCVHNQTSLHDIRDIHLY